MQVDLMNYENIIAAFIVVLVVIFALAAFLDNRWRKAGLLRSFGFGHDRNILPKHNDSDDKERMSNLYLRYADSSCLDVDSAEKQIAFQEETQQNFEEN